MNFHAGWVYLIWITLEAIFPLVMLCLLAAGMANVGNNNAKSDRYLRYLYVTMGLYALSFLAGGYLLAIGFIN